MIPWQGRAVLPIRRPGCGQPEICRAAQQSIYGELSGSANWLLGRSDERDSSHSFRMTGKGAALGTWTFRPRPSTQNGEIAANGYNIAVSSYVEERDDREAGDITTLNAGIARIVADLERVES